MKIGFTLAEILISIVIIGIIAAITISSLIQSTQKQEFVSSLKKTYSVLSQVTNQIIAEEGSPKADNGGWADTVDNIYDLYKKHLNNVKECGRDATCITQKIYTLSGKDFNAANMNYSGYRKLVTADGVQISIDNNISRSCTLGFDTRDGCVGILVDINGHKKPNKLGRDVFEFMLKEDGLFPRGCAVSNCAAKPGSSATYFQDGIGCACKVLREGAMNY